MWIFSAGVAIVASYFLHGSWALLTNDQFVGDALHLYTKSDEGPQKITPKIFILSAFDSEGEVWQGIPEFDILGRNVTVPGFSPLFPDAHCTLDGSICQLVTGEGAINAAATISALVYSPSFNLTHTYFLVAGVSGISPKLATIGSVTFARYTVQVTLQYEVDAREKPAGFSTGYIPQGALAPDQYPPRVYGTEVFEVNEDLRQHALAFAQRAALNDTASAQAYRAMYASNALFAPGAAPPSVVACDTATSDAFWSGALLAEAFENTTQLFTNGSATYCTTQQEDNGTLEVLLRGALAARVDFSRIIIMRTGSNFDRPFDGQSAAEHLFSGLSGFDVSIANIRWAGVEVVRGIVDGWEDTFAKGIQPSNYIGDILGSMGGQPDFGLGSVFSG
ncbi:purine nucleoside permease [Amylostereum chailletii]|nr:purine nucleoside permease [Amylostereum chailletii]